MKPDFYLNQSFGAAAAKVFGLDPSMVVAARLSPADQDSMDKPLTITFEVLIDSGDFVAIGEAMMVGPTANEQTQGVGDREVQYVDSDQPEEPAGLLPPHVWLYRNMCTELQRVAPLGIDSTNGQYAVAIDDLSFEQQAIPHVLKQLQELAAQRADVMWAQVASPVEDNEIV